MNLLNLLDAPLGFLPSLEYAGCAIALALLVLLCSYKPLAILQQCGYRNKKLLGWYARKDNLLFHRYCLLFLMLALTCLLLGICFAFLGMDIAFRLTLAPFLFFYILFYVLDKKYALKVPVNPTARLKRLCVVYFFIWTVVFYFFIATVNVIAYQTGSELFGLWRYAVLTLAPLAIPYILSFANLLDGVYERAVNKKYVTHAQEKLAKSDAIKIGITGSFAKTSVKNILTQILREKYTVLPTPASYNTPMGVAACVHGQQGELPQIFIAEMGARNVGDIQELCALVQPDYALLTGVCAQHLETFGSVENVVKTKAEIIDGTKKGGSVVIGKDEYTSTLTPDTAAHKILWVDGDAVQDIALTCEGTSFTLLYGEERLKIRTKLLGAHTAQNIALAATLAKELGITGDMVVSACEKLEYVPHRLEILHSGGVTVIDDSYNANAKGAEQAVEVLKCFSGRKFIVTPGIVELGILEESINASLGSLLTELDGVILVGETLVGAVKNGYLAAGGDAAKLTVTPTLSGAQEILKQTLQSGDTVLFLNDLPDVY
ncbi:MAG: UDP-N-acetylmuramoyl-tripeptide--D-alanyl-D-alanine ligase [Clostridia bacterium]|nr:UDP-N-acetylmuramoyl-tripeptide--D-alanyl-D-alanine ligase [Clostridia bacterium]